MSDIEIFGGDGVPNILQISAVAFDMDGKINDPHELIQVEDCWFDAVIPGFPGLVDMDTAGWWALPPQAAARRVLLRAADERGEHLGTALERFSRFIRPRLGKKGGHWANPPTFDLKVVRQHYEFAETPVPWHYRQERCMRTMMTLVKKLSPVKLPDMGNTGLIRHNGLHDAARQAVLVQAAYRALGLNAGNHARAERSRAAAS